MSKKYLVTLTDAQRDRLLAQRQGPLTLRQRHRVDVLLRAAAGATDAAIADALGIATNMVARIRQRFATGGLDAAVAETIRCGAPPKLDGKQEALIIALACSPALEGETRWTLRRLTERVVGLEIAETVSRETIRRLLKKRPQAVAEAVLVLARRRQRRVHLEDGRRSEPVRPAL